MSVIQCLSTILSLSNVISLSTELDTSPPQDSVLYDLTSSPVARAAMVSYTNMRLKVDIERERLQPLVVMDLVPLCSAQYERLFGTTRIPGIKAGTLLYIEHTIYK